MAFFFGFGGISSSSPLDPPLILCVYLRHSNLRNLDWFKFLYTNRWAPKFYNYRLFYARITKIFLFEILREILRFKYYVFSFSWFWNFWNPSCFRNVCLLVTIEPMYCWILCLWNLSDTLSQTIEFQPSKKVGWRFLPTYSSVHIG